MEIINPTLAVDCTMNGEQIMLTTFGHNYAATVVLEAGDVIKIMRYINSTKLVPDGRKFKLE